jgi:hypothetical protein
MNFTTRVRDEIKNGPLSVWIVPDEAGEFSHDDESNPSDTCGEPFNDTKDGPSIMNQSNKICFFSYPFNSFTHHMAGGVKGE